MKEEVGISLRPSSTMLQVCCVRLKLCGRRRQTVPSDDDVQNEDGCGLRKCVHVSVECALGTLTCAVLGLFSVLELLISA